MIDGDKIFEAIQRRVTDEHRKQVNIDLNIVLRTRFSPSDRESYTQERAGGHVSPTLQLLLSNVKVFCENCDGREAFSPIWFEDVANTLTLPNYRTRFDTCLPDTFQLFFLTYQCQRCKGIPIAFQVRRDGWHLILEGRSPIENVELPSFIPKAEKWLFRDALIAMHAGKVLAAQFYLRAFIEHFARRETGKKDKITGDDLMNEYSATLPTKFATKCHHFGSGMKS
jgi:hypothetical protein